MYTTTTSTHATGMVKRQTIFPTQTDWHTVPLTHLEGSTSIFQPGHHHSAISQLKSFAHSLLEEDVRRYQASSTSSTSSRRFLSTIIASGTLQDKVSALTLAIQESPVHNAKAFESLLGLASKKNRTQATGALGALVDLLGPGSVLPPSRKLKYFSAQPTIQVLCDQGIDMNRSGGSTGSPMTDIALISCVFEDWLKSTYFKVILLLESWCSNDVEYSRIKGLDYAYTLLREKPEQESNLLRLLIDRLRDRSGKVSSRASFLIRQLQPLHPGMTPIIIDTIDNMLLKDPATCIRTRYNAMITLNQTVITSSSGVVAKKLISVYFHLFRLLLEAGFLSHDTNAINRGLVPDLSNTPISDQGNIDKLISSILTGLNRALPFVKVTEREDIYAHVDTLFQIAQSPNFNASIQALMLLQKLCDNVPQIVDRFFSQVYESIMDPRLIMSSKQTFYLNLLTRVVRSDHDSRRVKAFAKRMVQVCDLHQMPFVSGVLYILSLAKQDSPDLSTLINDPEDRSTDGGGSESEVYDGWKRFPQFSNAHRSALWELVRKRTMPSTRITLMNRLGTIDLSLSSRNLECC
jgi:ribosome biogenesis protein MAK21